MIYTLYVWVSTLVPESQIEKDWVKFENYAWLVET